MRKISIRKLRSNLANELKNLPFEITNWGETVAVVTVGGISDTKILDNVSSAAPIVNSEESIVMSEVVEPVKAEVMVATPSSARIRLSGKTAFCPECGEEVAVELAQRHWINNHDI